MSKNIITIDFKEDLIKRVVDSIQRIAQEKRCDLDRIAVVFGGRRPALFVKRQLAKELGKSFLSPRFFTIDEFVSYTLNKSHAFEQSMELDNCYLLYRIAQEKTPRILEGRESFAQFLPWAREILNFIEQADLEHVDDKALLSIEANAQIGYDVPKDINQLLGHIVKLRKSYHKALVDKKVYSRGLQYLKVAENIAEFSFDEFEQILFCNFFYFNQSQEVIVKDLYKKGKATLLFQGDERKWPIFKRLAKAFDTTIQEKDLVVEPTYDLKLHAGFDVHSQISIVREILSSIKQKDQTVVVLPDAEHIVPLISEIAGLVEDFNISMGYSLKRSSLYSLLKLIFQAQLSFKDGRYYAKDYLKVLHHPFVKNLMLCDDPQVTRILVHKIEEVMTGKIKTDFSGSTFVQLIDIESIDSIYDSTLEMLSRMEKDITKDQLQQLLKDIHLFMFVHWQEVSSFSQFSEVLKITLVMLTEKSFLKNYPLNVNIALRVFDLIDEFNVSTFKSEKFLKEEIFRIFDNRISKEIVAFHGSPLKGLQILGPLETRSLNFKNVIMLDVNEGVMPKLNIYEPLIPREVMVSLGLDRLEYEEEIQRYQFLRLISSAENVHLVYEQSKDKERSRFVEELVWEHQKRSGKVDLIPVQKSGFEVIVEPNKKIIKKTKEMTEFLKEFSFSASSINCYLKDPVEFYYTYVLGLREKEDLLDEPEARHVGTFIHELLEEGFNCFVGKKPEITPHFRKQFMELFNQKFHERLEKSMKSDAFLLKSVIEERLERFLDNEMESYDRKVEQITHLEHRFRDVIPLKCGNIHFSYIIDRIDKMADGTTMIIDYKTGSVDQMPKSFEKIRNMEFSRETILDNIQSFQMPLYFHYLDKTFSGQAINAALYNLRTMKIKKFLDFKTNIDRSEINQFFLNALDFVISEILDPSIDFISVEE